jgi:hypothetical protein
LIFFFFFFFFYLARFESGNPLLALGLGATIEKEHAVPRGPEAEGRRDGRRPCARVAREGELSLGRAREGLLAWEGATALDFFFSFFSSIWPGLVKHCSLKRQ